MGKKKAFLNKKNAIHYRLIPKTAANMPQLEEQEKFMPTQEHLNEQHKFGVYFDDDYNYMQHLRDVKEVGTLQTLEEATEQEERYILKAPRLPPVVPSILFGESSSKCTNREEDVIDNDIDKALEGIFDDVDGDLEDDFISLAGGLPQNERMTQPREVVDASDEYESDSVEDDESDYDDREIEHSDGVIHDEVYRDGPRREIDSAFDKLLEADYHDDQMGELDGDDYLISGAIEPCDDRLKRLTKEKPSNPEYDELGSKEWTRQRIRLIEEGVVKDYDEMETVEVDESLTKRMKWDCESFATQHSNIYNHPTLIKDPKGRLSKRALKKLDKDVEIIDAMEEGNDDDDSMSQCTSISTIRPKDETPEQRRLRKQAVKEARRYRRQEKKQNKIAFADEHRKVAIARIGQIKAVPIV